VALIDACEMVVEPLIQLGTTNDCGFSPFGDDLSRGRVFDEGAHSVYASFTTKLFE